MSTTPVRRRRLTHFLEVLEARIAPATLVSYDNTTHVLTVQGDYVDDGSSVVQAGAVENLSFAVAAGNLVITDTTHHVTDTGAGTQITANQVNVPLAALTGDIMIDTGTGADSLTFNNTLALTANHSLAATTTGTIALAASAQYSVSGTGAILLATTRDISLASGSSLSVAGGDLHLTATGTVSGNYSGLNLAGSVTSTGAGSLYLTGTGGNAGTGNHGIALSGSVTSSGGGIMLTGTGGAGTDNNNGLSLLSGSLTGALGQISLTGVAGGDGGSSLGVDLGITVSGPAASDIEIHTDAGLKFEAGGAINAGNHVVVLEPVTAATPIDVGTFQRTGFGVSSAMLADIAGSFIEIGSGQAGTITVTAAVSSSHSLELLSAGGLSGAGAITVTNNHDFLTDTGGAVNLTGVLTVSGVATFEGMGSLVDITLNNSGNDFASVAIGSGHNVSLRDSDGFSLSADFSGLLTLNSAGTVTLDGTLSGGGDLLKNGAGTFTLGPTAIISSLFNNVTVSAGTVTFQSVLATGTITLGDSNTFSTVSLLAAGALGSNPIASKIVAPPLSGSPAVIIGTINFTGTAPADFTGTLMLDRPTTLQGGATAGTIFAGAISGNPGTLTIAGGHTVSLGGANSFVGDVKVTAASTLRLGGGSDVIPDGSGVDLAAQTFLVLDKDSNRPESISGLTGAGTVTTTSAMGHPDQSLTIGTNNTGFQFNGTIAQNAATLSLTKAGTGVVELLGSETYSGATIVANGFLELDNAASNNPLPNSSTIDIRAGATLDVSNLNSAAGAGTLVLGAQQTLRGAGAISGNLAGAGTVLPGGATSVGTLTINGTFAPTGHLLFKVNSPYAMAGVDYDQIVVSGAVDLSASSIALTGGTMLPGPAAALQVISNTSGASTVAGRSPGEGGILFASQSAFAVSYVGGDGNDVELTTAVAQASLAPTLTAGKLTIASTASGRSSQMSIFVSLGDLIVNSALDLFSAAPTGGTLINGNHAISIPVTKITKGVVINGDSGDDTLTLDLSTGGKLPTGGVTFNGGAQSSAAGDQLVISGGAQGDVTYTLASADDGSVAMSKFGKVSYTGLEPVVNTGDANNVTFNLPAGPVPNNAFLSDDGIAFNGLSRLRGSTFEQTDFKASGSLAINRGNANDSLSVANLLDLAASGVELGTPAKPFGNVAFSDSFFNESGLDVAATNLHVPAGVSLSPAGHGTLTVGGGVIDGTIDGDLGITKFGTHDLFLNGANTFTGDTSLPSGPVDLGHALALQHSTVHIGSSFALQFGGGIGTFTLGGLAGSGALPLLDATSAAVTLKVGANDSTYSGVLSGPGTLDKVGHGTLTLTGHNTHAATLIEEGTLQINSDLALGLAGSAVTFKGLTDGGTLHAIANVTTPRAIVLQSGPATFEASPGKTLTLSGVISGTGDFLVGHLGNVVVTGQSNTNTGSVAIGSGTSQMVNGVTITAPGTHGTVIVTPGPTPNEVASIDLTNANTPISVTVKSPKTGTVTVDKIVSLDGTAIKAVTLGANVILGDGVADGSPDLEIDGKLTTLTTADVNPNTIIRLGKGLAYLDTYKNNPNITIHDILGAGVTIDLTGDGVNAGVSGGGGLGKLVVNTWGSPGLIKTTQGIKSYLVKTGDSFASLQVDPGHLGVNTVANVGSISIPTGIWAGTGMQVEGVVAQFLTKGLAVGSTLTAGAFGTVKIKGNFGGSIVAAYDASVTVPVKGKPDKVIATGVIGNVTITSGDFSGLINGDGKVGNILLTGTARFTGTVRGASIGNITAASFTGTGTDGPRHSITAAGSIGNITATKTDLIDYLIAAGADLGSDAKLGGVADHFTSFTTSTTGVNTAVSIGNVTIKGTVTGTSIEAGVNPGPLGLFGDGDDALVPLPPLIKTKAKIGAMKFDALGTAALAFSDTTMKAIGNAFEAQSLLSIQIGKTKVVGMTFLNKFDAVHYVDSGASSIVVRLLT